LKSGKPFDPNYQNLSLSTWHLRRYLS